MIPLCIISITRSEPCTFVYDQNGNRVQKNFSDDCVSYEYDDSDFLVKEKREDITLEFLYDRHKLLKGFLVDGQEYRYVYDRSGDIVSILDQFDNEVCRYAYSNADASAVPLSLNEDTWIENSDPQFIGNINPFRYQGWYYDEEINCYYTGDGIFYDIVNNRFIKNDFTVAKEASTYKSSLGQQATELAAGYLNSSSYGTLIPQVSSSEWDRGYRWYDGTDITEITARCIFGENTARSANDDREGIARVIVNRRLNGFGSTLKRVITQSEAFSTVNPPKGNIFNDEDYDETSNARKAKSPTNSAWKHATLLACYLSLSTDIDELGAEITWPTGISSQLYYCAVNSIYVGQVKFKVENRLLYRVYNGQSLRCKDMAIAGVGNIYVGNKTLKEYLEPYTDFDYVNPHNLFYNLA